MSTEKRSTAEALLAADWSRSRVAAEIGVSRATLYREFPA